MVCHFEAIGNWKSLEMLAREASGYSKQTLTDDSGWSTEDQKNAVRNEDSSDQAQRPLVKN